jgi:hypothetical protein
VKEPLRGVVLQLRAARRLVPRGGIPLRERLARPDDRMVFVIGSPRSGTTFLGRSIGALPRFVDLGEVPLLKAAIPELTGLEEAEAAATIRRILDTTRRLGLVGARRAVEQTPESAFVAAAIRRAFPQATLVHVLRDGRDVVCSLLERGWLSAGRAGTDDAGHAYGERPRFWVEPERRGEFGRASDARRAAWAWRRYVTAARELGEGAVEVRYERLHAEPDAVAEELAPALDVDARTLATRLREAHGSSVGRYRRDLTPEQLADVEAEAGPLLRELGYDAAPSPAR